MTGTHRRNLSIEKGTGVNLAVPYNRSRAGSISARERSKAEYKPLSELGDNLVNSPSPLKRSDALPNLLNLEQALPGSPSVARTKRIHHHVKKQISVDNFAVPNHRDSPFGTPKAILNPSIHTLASPAHRQQRAPHPLSRGSILSNASTNSNTSGDSIAVQQRKATKAKHSAVDKFKLDLQQGDNHFCTPDALKAVKPLATAFMSTGLLSKRNRPLEHLKIGKPTPDTPCKRPTMIGMPTTPGTPGTPLGSKDSHGMDIHGHHQNHGHDNALDEYLFYDNEGDSSYIYASSGSDFDGTPHTPTRSLFGLNDRLLETDKKREVPMLLDGSPANDDGYFLDKFRELPFVTKSRSALKSIRSSPLTKDEPMAEFGSSQATITPAEKFSIPSILEARFENVQKLGMGEFSEVFVVEDRITHNKCAVKRSKTPYATNKERLRRQEEVAVLKQIGEHEHIIELQDSWEESGHLFMQTEYCENGSLDVFLQELGRTSRLDEFRVWKILLELALGVSFIHEQGFLHLDLKPANIFISFEGVLKIGDFGMSVEWPAPAHIEREGDREYIAPEVLSACLYDKPVDIFSLGLIILEIAGNIVLPDNGASWQKLRSGDLSDAPRLSSSSNEETIPSVHEPVVPHRYIGQGGLDRIVEWMVSPEPSDRPTAAAILNFEEVQWVNRVRRAGAVIYEGDKGPANYDIYMVNEESPMDDNGEDWRMEM